jgi:hypothetical protein
VPCLNNDLEGRAGYIYNFHEYIYLHSIVARSGFGVALQFL